jgi:hypothetical protein
MSISEHLLVLETAFISRNTPLLYTAIPLFEVTPKNLQVLGFILPEIFNTTLNLSLYIKMKQPIVNMVINLQFPQRQGNVLPI